MIFSPVAPARRTIGQRIGEIQASWNNSTRRLRGVTGRRRCREFARLTGLAISPQEMSSTVAYSKRIVR